MTALPNRTDPSFAMYYDGVEASRFGLGGTRQRTALGTVLLDFTDTAALTATHLMELANVGTDTIFSAHGTDAMTHSIRIRSAAGTDYFLMVTSTETNRDDGA